MNEPPSSTPSAAQQKGAAPPPRPPSAPSLPETVAAFRDMVANPAKEHSGSNVPLRRGGFVAVVRRAQGLEVLQAACREVELTHGCLTLRYRLDSRHAFGTLLRAALRDLEVVLGEGSRKETLGQLDPPVSHPRWREVGPGAVARVGELGEAGTIDPPLLDDLLEALGSREVLRAGMRLVVFGEVLGADGDPQAVAEWGNAAARLFPRLPERVGLVLSGAPPGFDLPEDGAHYMEVPELGDARIEDPVTGPSVARFAASELVADVPSSEDHLDREAYARSLATFLLHPDTAPPITFGLYGPWGTGKSSFFQLARDNLQREAMLREFEVLPAWRYVFIALRRRIPAWPELRAGLRRLALLTDGRPWSADLQAAAGRAIDERGGEQYEGLGSRRILTIPFNAWQYEDARQTWAGLASSISDRLEQALPRHRRLWMRLKYAWKHHLSDLALNFILPLVLLAATAVFALLRWDVFEGLFRTAAEEDDPLKALFSLLLPGGSILLLVWTVGWRLVEVVKPVSERLAGYVRPTDYRADMGYQHRVIADLKFLLREVEACHPRCRVLVYIDDLDRCSDEKIIEILRATILILADCRLFVMFGMDTAMIRRAIKTHYQNMKVPLEDADQFADSYLRKIVQIALYLPEAEPDRRFSLVESMFSEAARAEFQQRRAGTGPGERNAGGSPGGALPFDLSSVHRLVEVQTVEDTADELEALADFQDYLPDNPRELKRFINTHRFLKILLSGTGGAWSGPRQKALVKWLLFCSGWPTRVDDVLRHAREHPQHPDCLKSAVSVAASGWDERARGFADLGEHLPSTDLLGDFALAARLSQFVQDDAPAHESSSAAAEIVHLSPETVASVAAATPAG